jgi:hypothetical protein
MPKIRAISPAANSVVLSYAAHDPIIRRAALVMTRATPKTGFIKN